MPLLDHFHPPLKDRRHWQGFHNRWAAAIADALNSDLLPQDYFAEFEVHLGQHVEIDVATFEGRASGPTEGNGNGGTVLATRTWAPPVALSAIPAVFPDIFEVRVFSESGGATLVAAVELASPANKDRPEARRTFAAKCAAYLQRGIGLVIVDFVTERRANLHNELVDLLGPGEAFRFPHDSLLYTTAYHPVRRDDREEIDWWAQPLVVGQPMPTIPLPVRGLAILPLDLEAAYTDARRLSRLG
ncbi:MAG TPA: DUF4058 family protein [Gemmataceae bacterium]|nr:DUF4058 family protein [Gemmataceae bacterium]